MAKTEKSKLDEARAAATAAFLTSEANYTSSGFSGRLINPGYSGKVKGIDLIPLEGGNVTVRSKEQGPQMIGGKVVADEGEVSVVLSLVFDDGRSVALATLTNHPDTTIDGAAANKLTGKQWGEMIGKTLSCIDRIADEDRPNIRTITTNGVREVRKTAMQKYTFATVTP